MHNPKFESVRIDQLKFEKLCYEGLHNYGEIDKRIEMINLTKLDIDTKDIMIYFEKFIQRIEMNFMRVNIEYCICCVNHQHIHGLIKKPFVEYPVLQKYWEETTVNSKGIMLKTVRKDKTKKEDMKKLIDYISSQKQHHDTDDVRYYISPDWGYVKKKYTKKLEKDKIEIVTNINFPNGYYIKEKEQQPTIKRKSKTLKQIAKELKRINED